MPKIPIDYSKTIIYKIVCKDLNIKDVYVGQTTNLQKRLALHKRCCKYETDTHYNYKLYKCIRENGGFANWDIIMVYEYTDCENKLQASQKERYYIEQLEANLNCKIPARTQEEHIEYHKKYYDENKEQITKQQREYKQQNKEKINEYLKNWRQNIKNKY